MFRISSLLILFFVVSGWSVLAQIQTVKFPKGKNSVILTGKLTKTGTYEASGTDYGKVIYAVNVRKGQTIEAVLQPENGSNQVVTVGFADPKGKPLPPMEDREDYSETWEKVPAAGNYQIIVEGDLNVAYKITIKVK